MKSPEFVPPAERCGVKHKICGIPVQCVLRKRHKRSHVDWYECDAGFMRSTWTYTDMGLSRADVKRIRSDHE